MVVGSGQPDLHAGPRSRRTRSDAGVRPEARAGDRGCHDRRDRGPGFGHPSLGIRWPNDMQVGRSKLGGILPERVETERGRRLLIGVGLNVTTDLDAMPAEVRGMATSLAGIGEPAIVAVPLSQLLSAILDRSDRGSGDSSIRTPGFSVAGMNSICSAMSGSAWNSGHAPSPAGMRHRRGWGVMPRRWPHAASTARGTGPPLSGGFNARKGKESDKAISSVDTHSLLRQGDPSRRSDQGR